MVSENALKALIPVLDRAKRRPLPILISPWTEGAASIVDEAGLTRGKDILVYRDLVDEGQRGLDTPPAA